MSYPKAKENGGDIPAVVTMDDSPPDSPIQSSSSHSSDDDVFFRDECGTQYRRRDIKETLQQDENVILTPYDYEESKAVEAYYEQKKLEKDKGYINIPEKYKKELQIRKFKFTDKLVDRVKALEKNDDFSNALLEDKIKIVGAFYYTLTMQVYKSKTLADIEKLANESDARLIKKQGKINVYKRNLLTFFKETNARLDKIHNAKWKAHEMQLLQRKFESKDEKELDKATIKKYIAKARKTAKKHTTKNWFKKTIFFILGRTPFRIKTTSEKELNQIFDNNNKLRRRPTGKR
jgi:hypothetical protein